MCKGHEVKVYQVYLKNSREDRETRNEKRQVWRTERYWVAKTLGASLIMGEALNVTLIETEGTGGL